MLKKGKIAVVNMNGTPDFVKNFKFAKNMIEKAGKEKAQMICLPENSHFFFSNIKDYFKYAETIEGKTIQLYRDLAKKNNIWISMAGFPEKGEQAGKTQNAHILINNKGNIAQVYRKIHLFDVNIDATNKYSESSYVSPGKMICNPVDTPVGKLGLAICYDLRFPYLFAKMADKGAQVLLNPAAFLKKTGEAHWEALLRARAIENSCYVVAAAMTGNNYEKRVSYGHSLIIGQFQFIDNFVDPWGKVILDMKEKVGIGFGQIDLEYLQEIRKQLPSLNHRRPKFY